MGGEKQWWGDRGQRGVYGPDRNRGRAGEEESYCATLNPDFAIARGIRRRRPAIFFLKKFVHATSRTCTFFVETASASFVLRQRLCRPRCPELCDGPVLASIAKSGFNMVHNLHKILRYGWTTEKTPSSLWAQAG